jgi:hypothetical protein
MTREEVKIIVGLLMAAYPQHKIADLGAVVDAYYMGLSDYPITAIEQAVKFIIRNNKYFPSVAEIRGVVEQTTKYTIPRYDPMALRGEEVRMYETDNPDWQGLANRMRINGQECAATALERKANGLHDTTGLLMLADVLKPEMAMV